jgi:hypothetical protein
MVTGGVMLRFVAFAVCAAVLVLCGVGIAEAAFGGDRLPAPAPLIGLGLPIAGLVVGAIWLVRRNSKT